MLRLAKRMNWCRKLHTTLHNRQYRRANKESLFFSIYFDLRELDFWTLPTPPLARQRFDGWNNVGSSGSVYLILESSNQRVAAVEGMEVSVLGMYRSWYILMHFFLLRHMQTGAIQGINLGGINLFL